MKTCTLCKIEKPLDEYYKASSARDGLTHRCKVCTAAKNADSYARHRSSRTAAVKVYREANPEKVAILKRKHYEKNKDLYKARSAVKHALFPEIREEYSKTRYWDNREEMLLQSKNSYAANADRRRKYALEYVKNNRERFNAYQRDYRKRKAAENPLYALEVLCRSRILGAMRSGGFKKNTKTSALIGCAYTELLKHLEALFQPGMTWANRGKDGWHIDHKIPVSSAKTLEELTPLFHYSNLQPLWAKDNYAKGAKMPD
ncbi:hypothetical protein [Pseudomonas tolaasii]